MTSTGQPTTDVRKVSLAACVLLVLLRVSIGWQFFYEGLWKFQQQRTPTPWSAEGYLKNAQGPFREYFRGMVDDPYGLDLLDHDKTLTRWQVRRQKFEAHFQLDDAQKQSLDKLFLDAQTELAALLQGPAMAGVVNDKYKGTIDHKRLGEIELYRNMVARYEAKLKAVAVDFQQEHADKIKSELDSKYRELTGPVKALEEKLFEDARQLLTLAQLGRGSAPLPPQKIDNINRQTMWVLTISGLCLMAGLFTRTAAVLAALFLLNVYLTIPPWPGVPQPAGPEHSLIVNKNLIELIACLALAGLPSGRWIGLDALIHRFVLRGKTD